MANLPDDLRRALDAELAKTPLHELSRPVQRLIEVYREPSPRTTPILGSALDAAAYAAYRMPATYAAVRAVLAQVAEAAPEFQPSTQLDLGGGTGAAVWAAAATWPSLAEVRVLEQAAPVVALGRRLVANATLPAVRTAVWESTVLDSDTELPAADLVTVSYVLGELAVDERASLVERLAAHGGTVVLIEPGTPAGYERVVEARDQLIARHLTVLAPCPHDRECPIPRGRDWCHFSARVNRSSVHRQIKGATLGHEDEKFSYVAMAATPHAPATNRVLRHPQQRKGLVSLNLCTGADGLENRIVSKRHGDLYRAARDAEWGDSWPPRAL